MALIENSYSRRPDVDTSVYMQYGIYVGILLIHGTMNSIAVSWNGILNQFACKLSLHRRRRPCALKCTAIVFVNMLGILFIVIVGLAITRPLATASFTVSATPAKLVSDQTSLTRYIVYTILQWIWIFQ